jgi:hypothetical protein
LFIALIILVSSCGKNSNDLTFKDISENSKMYNEATEWMSSEAIRCIDSIVKNHLHKFQKIKVHDWWLDQKRKHAERVSKAGEFNDYLDSNIIINVIGKRFTGREHVFKFKVVNNTNYDLKGLKTNFEIWDQFGQKLMRIAFEETFLLKQHETKEFERFWGFDSYDSKEVKLSRRNFKDLYFKEGSKKILLTDGKLYPYYPKSPF